MGHTKADNLLDLKDELKMISELEGIKEKSPGIFYFKSIGFLHFHDKDDVRWADVKTKEGWKKLEIDFKANKAVKKKFLEDVHLYYQKLVSK